MKRKAPAEKPSPDQVRALLIDEFGALSERLRGMKRLEKRYDQMRSMILAPYAVRYPEDTIDEDGCRYSVRIGPKSMQRTVLSMEGLFQRLGKEEFFRLARIPFEELDRLILQRDLAEIVHTGRTGPRTVQSVERFTDAAPAR